MSPQHKFLLVGNETLKTKEACADYGQNVLNITVDSRAVIFRDDQCGRIVAQHHLGAGPLFLHTAMSSMPKCKGAPYPLTLTSPLQALRQYDRDGDSLCLLGGCHLDGGAFTFIPTSPSPSRLHPHRRQRESPSLSKCLSAKLGPICHCGEREFEPQ
jgi:hypothetical protein